MSDISPSTPGPDPAPAGRPTAPRRRWPWIIVAAVIVLGSAFLLWQRRAPAYARQAKPPSPPPLPISTVAARTGDIGIYVNALGTVTPVYTVTVKSRVDGQLMKVNYTEGQM